MYVIANDKDSIQCHNNRWRGIFLDVNLCEKFNWTMSMSLIHLEGCFCLAFIEIPASVTIVGSGTFYNCISLKMVIHNEGTTLIDEEAFSQCSTLLGMTIPSTINSIALDAFVGSNLLRNVSISLASNLTPEIFEQSFPTLSSMGISLDMILHRFDELPLHKYCYDSYPTHDIQPPCRVPCRCWSLDWGGYQTCVNVPVV